MGKGYKLIVWGIALLLLSYPLIEWIFSQDPVLGKYARSMLLTGISLGISLLLAGIIILKQNKKETKESNFVYFCTRISLLLLIISVLFSSFFGFFMVMSILIFSAIFSTISFINYSQRGIITFAFVFSWMFIFEYILTNIGLI